MGDLKVAECRQGVCSCRTGRPDATAGTLGKLTCPFLPLVFLIFLYEVP